MAYKSDSEEAKLENHNVSLRKFLSTKTKKIKTWKKLTIMEMSKNQIQHLFQKMRSMETIKSVNVSGLMMTIGVFIWIVYSFHFFFIYLFFWCCWVYNRSFHIDSFIYRFFCVFFFNDFFWWC